MRRADKSTVGAADIFDKAIIKGVIHCLVPEGRLEELLRIEAQKTALVKPNYEPRSGESLKEYLLRGRRELGLKQKDIPLSQGYISKIENGQIEKLRPTTMKRLVDCFTEAQGSSDKPATNATS